MSIIRLLARVGRVTSVLYLCLALVAAAVAIARLAHSTEMPGLAAWELLVLGVPWTLVLGMPVGRRADGFSMAVIVIGAVALNAWLLFSVASALGRKERGA